MQYDSDTRAWLQRRQKQTFAAARQALTTLPDGEAIEARLREIHRPLIEEERLALWTLVARETPVFTPGMRHFIGVMYPQAIPSLLENPAATTEDFEGVWNAQWPWPSWASQRAHFQSRSRDPLLPPPSAITRSVVVSGYAARPISSHQRSRAWTAKLPVS